MAYDTYSVERSDIKFYNRPATGYQVILLSSPRMYESLLRRSEASPRRLLKPVRERTIYRALHCVYEYRYGSPYSYPASNEAEARKQADRYAMICIANHWYSHATRMEARIYPFGGLIRDMRLVPRKPRRMYPRHDALSAQGIERLGGIPNSREAVALDRLRQSQPDGRLILNRGPVGITVKRRCCHRS